MAAEAATLKPIETRYAGCQFRSRIEARWAVFYDCLGLGWEYEPEGFEMGETRYLPDFRIEGVGWVEIKGKNPTQAERRKCEALSVGTGECVYMVSGGIPCQGSGAVEDGNERGGQHLCFMPPDGADDGFRYSWHECELCGRLTLTTTMLQGVGRCAEDGCIGRLRTCSPRLAESYAMARGFRFAESFRNHGVVPIPFRAVLRDEDREAERSILRFALSHHMVREVLGWAPPAVFTSLVTRALGGLLWANAASFDYFACECWPSVDDGWVSPTGIHAAELNSELSEVTGAEQWTCTETRRAIARRVRSMRREGQWIGGPSWEELAVDRPASCSDNTAGGLELDIFGGGVEIGEASTATELAAPKPAERTADPDAWQATVIALARNMPRLACTLGSSVAERLGEDELVVTFGSKFGADSFSERLRHEEFGPMIAGAIEEAYGRQLNVTVQHVAADAA